MFTPTPEFPAAAYLIRVFVTEKQVHYVPFNSLHEAETELKRVAPDGKLCTPYGITGGVQLQNFTLSKMIKDTGNIILEVEAESLDIIRAERDNPVVEVPEMAHMVSIPVF